METGPQDENRESDPADLAQRVREALARTDIMAVSTIGPDGPWTSPVQYRHNDKLELFFMSQAVLPHFIERGFGRIVMISSYVGQVGRRGGGGPVPGLGRGALPHRRAHPGGRRPADDVRSLAGIASPLKR